MSESKFQRVVSLVAELSNLVEDSEPDLMAHAARMGVLEAEGESGDITPVDVEHLLGDILRGFGPIAYAYSVVLEREVNRA